MLGGTSISPDRILRKTWVTPSAYASRICRVSPSGMASSWAWAMRVRPMVRAATSCAKELGASSASLPSAVRRRISSWNARSSATMYPSARIASVTVDA